jgi:hypothetical protein
MRQCNLFSISEKVAREDEQSRSTSLRRGGNKPSRKKCSVASQPHPEPLSKKGFPPMAYLPHAEPTACAIPQDLFLLPKPGSAYKLASTTTILGPQVC